MRYNLVKNVFLLITLVYIVAGCDNKQIRLIENSKETCLDCHNNMKGFSNAHDPNVIGCSACHLGNINANEMVEAHKGLIHIPGNLSNVKQTCSSTNCHRSEFDRINNSLMTTNSGIVSIDKFAFGEIHSTDTFFRINEISNTASDRHLKNLCFKCHLDYDKKEYKHTDQLSRGGGCLACHLNHPEGVSIDINDNIHPSIDLNIGNDKCFGCHSRSARISTSYEGWYETLFTKKEIEDSSNYRILQDGRVFGYAEEDVHHKAGLLCIDCHMSQEVMGDGKIYNHEDEAVKIKCVDCHSNDGYNRVVDKKNMGAIAALDYALRRYKTKTEKFLITTKDSITIVNSGFDKNNHPFLLGKIDQKLHKLIPQPKKCQKDKVHSNLDCSMCHTSWVPSCIGCHTGYDKNVVTKNGKKGKWFELVGEFGKSRPIMGIQEKENSYTVKSAIPGMIMTLDKSSFSGVKKGKDFVFHRLFAPISAHTITKEVRECKSCHWNSEALGYGKGKLSIIKRNTKSILNFESMYELIKEDSLPQDAWIGFLQEVDSATNYSAHEGFYPLNLKSQKRILQIGVCLSCHYEQKDFKDELLNGKFYDLLKRKSFSCIEMSERESFH